MIGAHPTLSKSEQRAIIEILQAHRIHHASLFGSFARGDAHAESDIDLLIDPPADWSLFDLSNLGIALETRLHRSVDLVLYGAINPRIAEFVLSQQIPLY